MTGRDLRGKVVAITGGGRGIGAATAAAFAQAGAKVAIGDLDTDRADEVARSAGGRGWHLDVRDPSSYDTFFDRVDAELGGFDVLVNNAGIMPIVEFASETSQSIHRQIDINLLGVVWGTQKAIARLSPTGGHIVNIASIAGLVGIPGVATYVATKHAVVGLTDTLRRELRDSGIGFTVVLPGHVRTELTDGVQQHWLAKSVGPEDVAAAIVNGVRRGKARVYVPRRVGVLTNIETVLPTRLADLATRVTGADRTVMTAALSPARAYYESRVGESGP